MNKYLSRLNPLERRFVVGVTVVVFIVLNFMFVWPHFGDRLMYQSRLDRAQDTLKKFDDKIAQMKSIEAQVKALENEGASVPEEDQAINFLRTIQSQASLSGVNIINNNHQPSRTNQFFIEQTQSVSIQATERSLVTFLYNLGEGNSMIRVRGLTLRPDPPHFQLVANVTLVASYQKKAPSRSYVATSKP